MDNALHAGGTTASDDAISHTGGFNHGLGTPLWAVTDTSSPLWLTAGCGRRVCFRRLVSIPASTVQPAFMMYPEGISF